MRTELTKRIFIACMIVFLMSIGLMFYMLDTWLARRNLQELQDKALYLSDIVQENGWGALEHTQYTSSTRITIIAPDGEVLFDTVLPVQQAENHSGRAEFRDALAKGSGSSERYSESLLKKTSNYAVRIHCKQNSRYPVVVLRVSMQQDTVWHLLQQMFYPLLAIICSMVILSVCLSLAGMKKIMHPIICMDAENPDDRNIYDEMKPLARKLILQNQKIYQQMEQLREEHKKQDAMRREFTANVSHELKTPLTSISGFAEIIRDGYVQQKDIAHFADNIYKEAQRMISLVNDILKLSRLESGSFEMQQERKPVNLLLVCQDVQERLSLQAQKQGVTVSCEGEDAIITGIPGMTDEIIYNICDNAIKYNHPGGWVHILVQNQKTENSGTGDNPEVIVTVTDNGIGIPEQDQERVFERFYRVNKSHSKEVGGTGLGMSIVKHGMALHRGSVTLESRQQQGTCVTLHFPVNR